MHHRDTGKFKQAYVKYSIVNTATKSNQPVKKLQFDKLTQLKITGSIIDLL